MINIVNMDCRDFMTIMGENTVDLTVTSPPYDNLRTYKDTLEWNENVWRQVIDGLWRVTKQGGVVVWVVGDATINGSETGTSFKQALYFKEVGFNLHDTMIYQKSGPPRQNGVRYEQHFEYMFVLSKGSIKIHNPITEKSKYGGKEVRRTCRDGGKDELTLSNTIVSDRKIKGNVWEYGVKKNTTGHPAIFPEQLAHDHIQSWSNPGDLVFDPFTGSGTTGKMALLNGREFIGCEKVTEFYEIAKKRLEMVGR